MLASLGYRALQACGVLALARLLRSDGVILCYHNVVATGDKGPGNGLGLHMPRTDFERQVRWLARHYDVVSLEEFVARRARGASLRGVAALTFDDGYAGVFAYAWPELQVEIVEARQIVQRHTGVTPQFFAYPYGLWNERLRETVRAAGYRAAFTLDHGRSAWATSAWSLPRVNVPAGIGDAAFQAWTAGLEPRRRA